MNTSPISTPPIRRAGRALLVLALFTLWPGAARAEDEIEKAFRDALYAEEVKGDVEAALKAYEDVATQFELKRDLAATALFRQGECQRKLGRQAEAIAAYEKLLAQYPDRERVAKLARENLVALGKKPAQPTATAPAVEDEESKEIARLKELIKNSPDLLNATASDGGPPLHMAALKGQAKVAQFLLEAGAKPDLTWQEDMPLHAAVEAGHKAVCELILDSVPGGAALNAKNQKGETPLLKAILAGREAIAMMLLARKADPNQGKHTKEISLPGILGSSVQFWAGLAPIHAAAASGPSSALLEALLEARADPNTEVETTTRTVNSSPGLLTPLALAVAHRQADKVNLLLARKANPNIPAGHDRVPLLLLALANADTPDTGDPIVKALLAAGADWKATTIHGVSALHVAAHRGMVGWLQESLKAGLPVDAKTQSHDTPLHLAVGAASPECVKLLIEAKADLEAVDQDGNTPLLKGSALPHSGKERALECLRLLLAAGANPNVVNQRSMNTPLSSAFGDGEDGAQGIWTEGIALLLDHGANPRIGQGLRFLSGDGPDQIKSPTGQAKAVFPALWKAAHFGQHNPRRPHAVWLSRGQSLFENNQSLSFRALYSEEAATGPGKLSQFLRTAFSRRDLNFNPSTLTIFRRAKDAKDDEAIPVDFLAIIRSGDASKDLALQWGDIVEVPWLDPNRSAETIRKVDAWFAQPAEFDLRVKIGENHFFANAENETGPVFRVPSNPRGGIDPVRLAGGLPAWRLAGATIRRTVREGILEERIADPTPVPLHGDIIEFALIEPRPKLSEEALKAGVFVCPSLNGPFWPASKFAYWTGPTKLGNLPGLLLSLMAPSGLPLHPTRWEEAKIRRWKNGAWEEKALLSTWAEDSALLAGTVLILPPSTETSFIAPENLRKEMRERMSFDWRLAMGDEPQLDRRYEPPFFRAEKIEGKWIWRDLTPDNPRRPLLSDVGDLLALEPALAGKSYDTQFAGDALLKVRPGQAPRNPLPPGIQP